MGSATRKKNFFILDTQTPSRKMMLVKSQGQPTYLLSNNLQIRLWHRRLRHTSNARVVEAFKLNDGIDITIEDDLLTENLSSDLGIDDKDKCKYLGQTLTIDNKYERFPPLIVIINNPNSSEIEKLCDPCIESKHTKVVRHKEMTLTTKKLQEIHADLWGPYNPPLLLRKTYVGLLLDKFT